MSGMVTARPAVHVLYVIDSLDASGGAESSLAALAAPMVTEGLRLDVAYLHERPGVHDELRTAGASLFSLVGPRRTAARRVAELTRRRAPDLVHTTLFEADVSGRIGAALAGVPCVTSLVNASYGADHVHDPALLAWKVRGAQALDIATATLATRFHANAQHVADLMSRRLLIPQRRIDVIPRGRDDQALGRRSDERSSRVREHLGVDPTTTLIVAVARHERQKGIDVLIDALPRVLACRPQIQVVIAGREGNQTAQLRDAIVRLGLDDIVRLLGTRDDVADLLSAADLLVAPSRWEGLPGVLIEALALEAPIVASDLPAVHEVVGSGGSVAHLVPPDRPAELADAIVDVLSDPSTATARARRGRARFICAFTIESIADRMIEFYGRSVSGGNRRWRLGTIRRRAG